MGLLWRQHRLIPAGMPPSCVSLLNFNTECSTPQRTGMLLILLALLYPHPSNALCAAFCYDYTRTIPILAPHPPFILPCQINYLTEEDVAAQTGCQAVAKAMLVRSVACVCRACKCTAPSAPPSVIVAVWDSPWGGHGLASLERWQGQPDHLAGLQAYRKALPLPAAAPPVGHGHGRDGGLSFLPCRRACGAWCLS